MRILQVTTHFFPFVGGLEHFVLDLSREQAKSQDVTVLTLKYNKDLETETRNDNIRILRFPGYCLLPHRYIWPRFGFSRKISEINPDVVFTHTRFFATSFFAGQWAKHHHKKWIHVEHGEGNVHSKNIFLAIAAQIIDAFLGKWIFKNADVLVVFSEKAQKFVEQNGVDSDKIKIIPSGISIPSVFKPIPRKNNALFFGRMVAEKGVREILECAAQCPDWTFELVGSGSLFYSEILPNVLWTPEILHECVPEKIQNADVILAPSYAEGFSLSVLESLAEGRAVISTRVGIAQNLLSPEFFIPSRDAHALCEKLKFFSQKFFLLEQEGRKNYERAHLFSFERMMGKYNQLLSL